MKPTGPLWQKGGLYFLAAYWSITGICLISAIGTWEEESFYSLFEIQQPGELWIPISLIWSVASCQACALLTRQHASVVLNSELGARSRHLGCVQFNWELGARSRLHPICVTRRRMVAADLHTRTLSL